MYITPVEYCRHVCAYVETDQNQLQCSAQNGCTLQSRDCPLALYFVGSVGLESGVPLYGRRYYLRQ